MKREQRAELHRSRRELVKIYHRLSAHYMDQFWIDNDGRTVGGKPWKVSMFTDHIGEATKKISATIDELELLLKHKPPKMRRR